MTPTPTAPEIGAGLMGLEPAMVLVPREPTDEMLSACSDAIDLYVVCKADCADVWSAMIFAAPIPLGCDPVVREALERLRIMTKQKLPDELDEDDQERADWRGGYETFCHESRAIFAALSQSIPEVGP
jgi:hypothetical protein